MTELIYKKEVNSCMGIVVTKKNNIIYVALLKDKNNFWVIPKGHSEASENFIDTAIREVKEETGINISKSEFIKKIYEYQYYADKEKCNKIVHVYLFQINLMEHIIPLLKENFIDGKWFSINEAINIITYPEQREALNKVKAIML